ncbi:MAG: putative anti-sigma regulatory factor, serine/threonine protein kinase [Bryobacterales bacterium]|nr:putative anti-sigma regulatory factor, serine/threonine protein kinase [Bryobacterales bacterium]
MRRLSIWKKPWRCCKMKRGDMSHGRRIIPIVSDADIVEARMAARTLAEFVGFSGAHLVMIATAVSEVARNIIEYAKPGEVVLSVVQNSLRRGLEVVARDQGPGIADISQAMQDGFSTSRSLGLGLPGSRRLMDEFEVESKVGLGTTVTMRKWLP